MLRAVDIHGFGGGFTLGTVQAGFELQAKFSRYAGFGVFNTLGNRKLLGNNWESIATDPTEWDVVDADFVFGNPPCAAFSTLSRADFRGKDNSINNYMWELVEYAGRVAPPIVAWESVQQTFSQGLSLMRQLHDRLEEISGKKYTLYHVLHNNLSHGGISMRKRYFWVASQIPFGVNYGRVNRQGLFEDLDRVPVFGDMLGDLAPLGLTMSPQRYRAVREVRGLTEDDPNRYHVLGGSFWTERETRAGLFVDGHDTYHAKGTDLAMNLLTIEDIEWPERWPISGVLREYYKRFNHLPKGWQYPTKRKDPETGEYVVQTKEERLIETNFNMGLSQPFRWSAERPAQVVTGGAIRGVVHPYLPRFLTHREVARIQGFPDDWEIFPIRNAVDLGPGWGKGVPVQAGRWIARNVRAALEGEPGELKGVPLAEHHRGLEKKFGPREREFVINTTYAFRDVMNPN